MRIPFSFLAGVLFAVGLAVGGMTHPNNVIGFLDIFGTWRPELMLVMGGAVVTLILVKLATSKLRQPLYAPRFHIPTRREMPPALFIGSAMFGIGWGLSGFCPGPAIASLATGSSDILLFLTAMAVGMAAHSRWQQRATKETR